MPAHYLLTPASRDFPLLTVMSMTDDAVFRLFCLARWPNTEGAPVCDRCNMPATGPHSRRRFRCLNCGRLFTVTSGTALAYLKLPLRLVLILVAQWAIAPKGRAARYLSQSFGLNYRTVFSLCHKLRHAMTSDVVGQQIGGPGVEVEADGCYLGGHVRPTNWVINRRDRRFARNKSDKRRVVVVVRERRPNGRTLVFVVKHERQGAALIAKVVRPGSIIHADSHFAWLELDALYETKRINHEEAYSDGQSCTNHAESFFARLRRLEAEHHHIAGPYLLRYATEAAFKEDQRRLSAADATYLLLHLALNSKPDHEFKNYRDLKRRRRQGGQR